VISFTVEKKRKDKNLQDKKDEKISKLL